MHVLARRVIKPRAYSFVAYAHSTATNNFDITHTVSNVAVQTNPVLAIDTPAANSTVLHTFFLSGWASI